MPIPYLILLLSLDWVLSHRLSPRQWLGVITLGILQGGGLEGVFWLVFAVHDAIDYQISAWHILIAYLCGYRGHLGDAFGVFLGMVVFSKSYQWVRGKQGIGEGDFHLVALIALNHGSHAALHCLSQAAVLMLLCRCQVLPLAPFLWLTLVVNHWSP